jgi:replicative superfamily II helicase
MDRHERRKGRAALRKAMAECIEFIERRVVDLTTPNLVSAAQWLRAESKAENEPKRLLRAIYSNSVRDLLDLKSDIPRIWHAVDDEATAALVRRCEATFETAIKLIDEQARLIDEALGAEPTTAPLQ